MRQPNAQIIRIGELVHDALLSFAIRYPNEAIDDDLSCGCAIGSTFLIKEVRRRLGLRMSFRASDAHAWTEYGGFIYDTTATQFGATEKVLVVPLPIDEKKPFASQSRVPLSIYADWNANYLDDEWPEDQHPDNYTMKLVGGKLRLELK